VKDFDFWNRYHPRGRATISGRVQADLGNLLASLGAQSVTTMPE